MVVRERVLALFKIQNRPSSTAEAVQDGTG